ncbi:MAG: hypothetical protein KDA68_23540 [Planctomycetaceae bacterium]|nr:hypothetical protein [Planctomycetaceae bacterium]
MTGMEKLIWTEFLVALGSALLVALLYPWLKDGAAGGFGLMGLMVLGAYFIRNKGAVVDERDQKIELDARLFGVGAAWMTLLLGLIGITQWANYQHAPVSIRLLNWLIWISFAVCYLVKGLAGIIAYRRQSHAA